MIGRIIGASARLEETEFDSLDWFSGLGFMLDSESGTELMMLTLPFLLFSFKSDGFELILLKVLFRFLNV